MIFHWEPTELTDTIGRANAAGWQVAIHTVSREAYEMVLNAHEAALGPAGPNPLHHRVLRRSGGLPASRRLSHFPVHPPKPLDSRGTRIGSIPPGLGASHSQRTGGGGR
jgi:hypothetical protein